MPAHKPPLPDGSAGAMNLSCLPELSEADFISQVFFVKADDSAVILEHLITKAASLGVPVSRTSSILTSTDRHLAPSAFGAESSITTDTNHARTISTESKSSASTTLTSAASEDHNHEPTVTALSRKKSRNLAFSQYDKFLLQVNPNLDQPKFLNLPAPTERHSSTPSLFSVSTRKSYLGIRNGLQKIRDRRKSSPFPEALIKLVYWNGCCPIGLT